MKYNYLMKAVMRERLQLLAERQELYKTVAAEPKIIAWQLETFNKIWYDAYTNIPFYSDWKSRHNIPGKIYSIKELQAFPVLTKQDIQANRNIIFGNLPACNTVSTGGSTGEPAKFPVSEYDHIMNYVNIYTGRSWSEIKPFEKIAMVWGHSHLFGSGIKGRIKIWKRNLQNILINTLKISAYDLTPSSIDRYCREIHRYQPAMIYGYTSAVRQIARYMVDKGLKYSFKGLKAVVLTAETVAPADKTVIAEAFQAPVVIEYGMAEAGIIAYSNPQSDSLRVLWASCIAVEKNGTMLVTTIGNRLFPLINYSSGDVIRTDRVYDGSILAIESVSGREHDILRIRDGNILRETHGEFFTHVLKAVPGVFSFRILQKKENDQIRVEAVLDSGRDINAVKADLIREIRREIPACDPGQFCVVQKETIEKTIAGKERWVVVE